MATSYFWNYKWVLHASEGDKLSWDFGDYKDHYQLILQPELKDLLNLEIILIIILTIFQRLLEMSKHLIVSNSNLNYIF